MIKQNRVLFVSHEASRTGAPIVLLHLLRWLKANGGIYFDVLLKSGGELEPEFAELADVFLYDQSCFEEPRVRSSFWKRFFAGKKHNEKKQDEPTVVRLAEREYDLIYFNTVAANDIIPVLREVFKCRIVCHVHENEFVIKTYFSECMAEAVRRHIDHFIVVSKSTKEGLIKLFSIAETQISICYGFIPVKEQSILIKASGIREELGIDEGDFVVGASGTCSWRKGTDLFLMLARILNELKPDNNIKFVWVGLASEEMKHQITHDLEKTKLKDKVLFVGHRKHPQSYFNIFNVFALMSREDPFPLVCLEAAAMHKPILCFENAGGMPELIRNGGGIIVPYADLRRMAEVILSLSNDQLKMSQLSFQVNNLVQKHDVDEACPAILELIKRIWRVDHQLCQ